MLPSRWTSWALLGFVLPVFSQGPHVPDPLPLITPPDVVNLFMQNSDDQAGDLVASVIAVDATATTFLVNCAPSTSCGFGAWENPIIMTQGPSNAHWTYAETQDGGFSVFESCTFDGTTASTAICTNSYNDNANDYPYTTDDWTTVAPFTTLTYDGFVGSGPGSIYVIHPSYNGPPPFIPVKITAGLSLLGAFKAATTGTSSGITSSSLSQATPSQAITSPTITSVAKATGSTSSDSSSGRSTTPTTPPTALAAGNNSSSTTKASSAKVLKPRWEWCWAMVFVGLAL